VTGPTPKIFRDFIQDMDPTNTTFKRIFDTVEFRGSSFSFAHIVAKALGLRSPGADCRFWLDGSSDEAYVVRLMQLSFADLIRLLPAVLTGETRHDYLYIRNFRQTRWIATATARRATTTCTSEAFDKLAGLPPPRRDAPRLLVHQKLSTNSPDCHRHGETRHDYLYIRSFRHSADSLDCLLAKGHSFLSTSRTLAEKKSRRSPPPIHTNNNRAAFNLYTDAQPHWIRLDLLKMARVTRASLAAAAEDAKSGKFHVSCPETPVEISEEVFLSSLLDSFLFTTFYIFIFPRSSSPIIYFTSAIYASIRRSWRASKVHS